MADSGGLGSAGPSLGGPGFDMVESVRDAIKRWRMVPEGGSKVVACVSGGPDSVCLLDALGRLASTLNLGIAVAHVDHGLSSDSEKVAAGVATRAAEAGYEVHVVRAPGIDGPNLQARAREFRYGFFDLVAEREEASAIATGHTLDDRVETTLARLIHGAGTSGLAGLRPIDGNRIHPLIEVRRADTRAYCDERALAYVDDPANEDPRFERVSIRRDVLGAIERRWGAGAVRAIATSSERLREDADLLAALADGIYQRIATAKDGVVTLSTEDLTGTPRAIRRRVLETAVGRMRDRSGGIDAALDALDANPVGTGRFSVARGAEISITNTMVTVARSEAGGDAPGDG